MVPPLMTSTGQVKPNNIRHTHFSHNPKKAFLIVHHFVKEFGEGFDHIYRELEANGTSALSFCTDNFILKISVPKVADISSVQTEKLIEPEQKVTEKLIEKAAI